MLKFLMGAAVVAATAAAAQAPNAPTRSGPDNDPEEIVCVNEQVIGSRLARRRVCRTRAEWEQLRDQTRTVVERVQFQKQTTGQ